MAWGVISAQKLFPLSKHYNNFMIRVIRFREIHSIRIQQAKILISKIHEESYFFTDAIKY